MSTALRSYFAARFEKETSELCELLKVTLKGSTSSSLMTSATQVGKFSRSGSWSLDGTLQELRGSTGWISVAFCTFGSTLPCS